MSSGSWLTWGNKPFDELVEKATSEFTPATDENIGLFLEICDQIRSKQVTAKQAVQSLKKRLDHKNPNVQLKTLSLLDVCIKNGGSHFLIEVASRDFVDTLVSLLKTSTTGNYQLKEKILEKIQAWAVAFKGKPELTYFEASYRMLQNEGFQFPQLDTAAASAIMVDTETAPDWVDSSVCMRCRTTFSLTNRKHHCRNCGQCFDQQCTSKTMSLPHYGINEEVRVCDGCHMKLLLKKQSGTNISSRRSPASRIISNMQTSVQHDIVPQAGEDDDADLKKAIELSLQEARGNISTPSQPPTFGGTVAGISAGEEEDDPELAAAIAASLREIQAPAPSAPISSLPPTPASEKAMSTKRAPILNPHLLTSVEEENILLFSTLVERIKKNGGEVLQDGQLQELYEQIGALKPKLYRTLNETVTKHKNLVEMHEKVTRCIRTYDGLLEQKLANANLRRSQSQLQHSSVPQAGRQGLSHPPPQVQQPPPQRQINGMYPTIKPSSPSNPYPYNYGSHPPSQSPVQMTSPSTTYAPPNVPNAYGGPNGYAQYPGPPIQQNGSYGLVYGVDSNQGVRIAGGYQGYMGYPGMNMQQNQGYAPQQGHQTQSAATHTPTPVAEAPLIDL